VRAEFNFELVYVRKNSFAKETKKRLEFAISKIAESDLLEYLANGHGGELAVRPVERVKENKIDLALVETDGVEQMTVLVQRELATAIHSAATHCDVL